MAEKVKKDIEVSIIIPCKKIETYTKECLENCQNLDYSQYEVLVLPDEKPSENFNGIEVIATGEVGPAEKRDMAAKLARGEILAFIDDDAYPSRNWLKNAVRHFQNGEVGAVVGPHVTPESDGLSQKANGAAYASFMGSGSLNFAYVPKAAREVDDYPSCNMLVRKSVFKEAGGFDSTFYPGEDTRLCLKIAHSLGKKIWYDPEVLVYHHRRKLLKPLLIQVWRFAVHRGFFAKRFPENSRRPFFFLPSLFVLGLILGIPLAVFFTPLRFVYLGTIGLYLVLVLASSITTRDIRLIPLVVGGIVSMHLTYGAGFIKGLLTRRLAR
jgi:cellulose synthase/poly-beta-1,6-N-acetylglucosamine synthase-like glycosyltransferase